MVGIEIQIEVKPEKRPEFLQAVESLQRTVGSEAACESQHVYEERGHPNQFLWVERWTDTEEIRARLRSAKFRSLMGAIRVLGMASELSVVESQDWFEPRNRTSAHEPAPEANNHQRDPE